MLLMIDNYDSFTYNLVQYFGELEQEVVVFRNDEVSLDEVAALRPAHIVISPGPCTPNEAGISVALIRRFAGEIPILGVCLGHQSIGQAFGGKIVHAKRVSVFDRCAHFREQAVHCGCKLGHVALDGHGRRRNQVAVLHRQQALAERRKRTGTLTIGPFGRDIADQQTEGARHKRGHDLLVELRQVEERGQRKEEGRKAGCARSARGAPASHSRATT